MPTTYCAQATASFEANANSLAIEIQAPANESIKIKKIRIMHDDGTATVTSDYHKEITLVSESAAGSGGTSFTPIKLDPNVAASSSTVNVNVSGTLLFLPGTVSDNIDVASVHSATDFYWAAADEDDKIVIAPGGIFGIVVNPAQ